MYFHGNCQSDGQHWCRFLCLFLCLWIINVLWRTPRSPSPCPSLCSLTRSCVVRRWWQFEPLGHRGSRQTVSPPQRWRQTGACSPQLVSEEWTGTHVWMLVTFTACWCLEQSMLSYPLKGNTHFKILSHSVRSQRRLALGSWWGNSCLNFWCNHKRSRSKFP